MRDTRREGCHGVKPPEPPRAGLVTRKPVRGFTVPVWELRCALLEASQRLPRGTGLQSLLEGAERYVKLTGKGRPGPGPGSPESVQWWADVLALVQVLGQIGDRGTVLLLGPWLRPGPGGSEFKPFGG